MLSNALGPHRDYWVKPGETTTHAAERLQGALAVRPIADTYQLVISLESSKSRGLAEVVNSVVNTFVRKMKDEQFYGLDERIQHLHSDRHVLDADIIAKEQQRAQIAEDTGVSTFNEAAPNAFDNLLVLEKQALAEARHARIQAEAQVESIDPKQHPDALRSYVLDQVSKDPALASLEANLNQRRSNLLTSISGMSASHPARRAAELELKELDQEQERLSRELISRYTATLREQRLSEARRAARVEQQIAEEVKRKASQAAEFSGKFQRAINLGQDIERDRQRLNSIDNRVEFLSLESRAPGFIRVFSPARPPDEPVKGGKTKLLAIVLVLACVLGMAVPVAIDFLDPRIHWPGSAAKYLGFAPMAWIMEKSEAGDAFQQEQILRLANKIAQEQQANGSQIFAFSSVKSGGGTTTLVYETALALNRLGIPTLAVEANAYRSDPRYRSPGSRGLTVVLRGHQTLESEIVPGDEDRPDLLPVGDVNNLKNLPDLERLIEVLRQATNVYRVILVDVPPLLISVDAELVARSADLVTLIIEAGAVTRSELGKAAKQLERMNPHAVAAILNRVSGDAAAGFARQARDEFYSGRPKRASFWTSPWLWR